MPGVSGMLVLSTGSNSSGASGVQLIQSRKAGYYYIFLMSLKIRHLCICYIVISPQ
jgi:hypothetical protein